LALTLIGSTLLYFWRRKERTFAGGKDRAGEAVAATN
jgi:hypothetical protein